MDFTNTFLMFQNLQQQINTLALNGNVPPALTAQVNTNTSNITSLQVLTTAQGESILTNTSNIVTNSTDIATNTSNITTLDSNVGSLTSQVSTNTSNITTLQGQVSVIPTLQTDVATNTSNIATNTSNITTLQGQVSVIPTLQTAVATNTSNITTNTTNIATNTSNITAIQTSLGTSTDLGTTTAWGQARLSRPITNFSTTLRSTSALPASRATAITYGEVLLNLLDTGNTQERTIGNANITIKNAGNTNADIFLQIVVNGSITEIVATVIGGTNHSTTISIAGFSSSIATSGSVPIRLNAWTLSGQTVTPTYIQIWGIGQMN